MFPSRDRTKSRYYMGWFSAQLRVSCHDMAAFCCGVTTQVMASWSHCHRVYKRGIVHCTMTIFGLLMGDIVSLSPFYLFWKILRWTHARSISRLFVPFSPKDVCLAVGTSDLDPLTAALCILGSAPALQIYNSAFPILYPFPLKLSTHIKLQKYLSFWEVRVNTWPISIDSLTTLWWDFLLPLSKALFGVWVFLSGF
jgi:hypothetical protein